MSFPSPSPLGTPSPRSHRKPHPPISHDSIPSHTPEDGSTHKPSLLHTEENDNYPEQQQNIIRDYKEEEDGNHSPGVASVTRKKSSRSNVLSAREIAQQHTPKSIPRLANSKGNVVPGLETCEGDLPKLNTIVEMSQESKEFETGASLEKRETLKLQKMEGMEEQAVEEEEQEIEIQREGEGEGDMYEENGEEEEGVNYEDFSESERISVEKMKMRQEKKHSRRLIMKQSTDRVDEALSSHRTRDKIKAEMLLGRKEGEDHESLGVNKFDLSQDEETQSENESFFEDDEETKNAKDTAREKNSPYRMRFFILLLNFSFFFSQEVHDQLLKRIDYKCSAFKTEISDQFKK